MADISQIVDVTISLETAGVTRQGFGKPLLIGDAGVLSSGVVAEYASLAEMVSAGFADTDEEYKMAQAIFSQSPSPSSVFVAPLTGGDYGDSIQDAFDASKDWYAVIIQSRLEADILDAAAKVETIDRLLLACSNDAAVTASSSGNVLADLKAANYDRTSYLWSDDQANYPEAAWAGVMLPKDPGSATWMFKTLTGITADDLTTTEQNNVLNENGNTYQTIGGVSITREGKVASGEYLDVIRGIDWLKARIEEDIYQRLVNVDKVPFTDAGIAIIDNILRERLQDAVDQGVLASFTVSVPTAASVSAANKAARTLPDVDFTGVLAGAIHKVEINGTVSL